MDGKVIMVIANSPYMDRKQVAESLNISTRTVTELKRAIQEGIKAGRYDPMVIVGNRLNFYAVLDCMKYKDALEDKRLRDSIPPFNPGRIAELCGYCMKVVRTE